MQAMIGQQARTAQSGQKERLSPWSKSAAKRVFDFTLVILALPALIPIFLLVGLAVALTSRGPIVLPIKQVGRNGRAFGLLKFRTFKLAGDRSTPELDENGMLRFTLIGPFLRRSKLDEFPQLLNVLRGDMSLVGPRPQIPEFATFDLPCRPGVTGAATLVFAREGTLLEFMPMSELEAYLYDVVLPAKLLLDRKYMAHATIFTDLKILLDTISRRWDTIDLDRLTRRKLFHTLSAIRTLPEIEVLSSGRGPSAVEWLSTVALAIASGMVFGEIVHLIRFDWQYALLLPLWAVAVGFLAERVLKTLTTEYQIQRSELHSLTEEMKASVFRVARG